jgi:hypothetical protein
MAIPVATLRMSSYNSRAGDHLKRFPCWQQRGFDAQVEARTMHYRSPLRSAMQPDRISLEPVHPRPYDLFPLARQREHVLAIDQVHQCRPVTCISRVVMRWASADVTVSNITVPIRSSFFTSVFLLLEINRTPN